MKSNSEIWARARECVAAELENRLLEASLRLPHRCVHNHRQALDSRKTVEGEPNARYNRINITGDQTIGLCMLGAETPEDWNGTICEEPLDAQRCPYFTPLEDKEAVIRKFAEDVKDPEWVHTHMPELAALMWVLDESAPPRLMWIQRLFLYFRRVRIEPVRPSLDLDRLLPEAK